MEKLNKMMYKELIEYIILVVLFFLTNKISYLFGIISFIYCIVIILSGDKYKNLRLLFFLLPNIRILDITGYKFLINLLYILISFKYLFSKKNIESNEKKKFKIKKSIIIATLAVFFLEVIHFNNIYSDFYSQIFNAINLAFDFFICVILIQEKRNFNDYRKISLSLLLGVISSAIIFILANDNIISMIFSSRYRLSAYGNDPNYLSFYIILGVCAILFCSYYNKLSIIDILVLVIVSGIGLLTSSKMCILCLISIFVIYIYTLFKKSFRKLFSVIFKILPITLLFILLFNNELTYLIEKFFERFEESYSSSSLGNLTSGRSEILIFYIDQMYSSLFSILFGRGINYYSYYQIKGASLLAHNTYFDFLLSWGILGVIVFLIFFIVNIPKSNNKKIINYLPLMYFAVMLMSLSCMSSDMFWYLLAFVIMPLNINKEKYNDIQIN